MKKILLLSMLTAAPLLGFTAAATAAPAMPMTPTDAPASIVEKARADCRWVDNKWTYQRGDKRLECRPNRPSGRGWNWRREGNRYGWYDNGRKAWHFNAW